MLQFYRTLFQIKSDRFLFSFALSAGLCLILLQQADNPVYNIRRYFLFGF